MTKFLEIAWTVHWSKDDIINLILANEWIWLGYGGGFRASSLIDVGEESPCAHGRESWGP
jgi:hypothetical protein